MSTTLRTRETNTDYSTTLAPTERAHEHMISEHIGRIVFDKTNNLVCLVGTGSGVVNHAMCNTTAVAIRRPLSGWPDLNLNLRQQLLCREA